MVAINRSTACTLVHQRKQTFLRARKILNVRQIKYWRNNMPPQWIPERRKRQSELVRQWKPGEKSKGPQSPDGKARSSRNAWKDGQRPELRELAHMVTAEVQFGRALVRFAHDQPNDRTTCCNIVNNRCAACARKVGLRLF